MSIEKMRLALEALEEINKYSLPPHGVCLPGEIDTAIDALRNAIEYIEKRKPIAYYWPTGDGDGGSAWLLWRDDGVPKKAKPLYGEPFDIGFTRKNK